MYFIGLSLFSSPPSGAIALPPSVLRGKQFFNILFEPRYTFFCFFPFFLLSLIGVLSATCNNYSCLCLSVCLSLSLSLSLSEEVVSLINEGKEDEVNEILRNEKGLLHEACATGSVDVVTLLLDRNVPLFDWNKVIKD